MNNRRHMLAVLFIVLLTGLSFSAAAAATKEADKKAESSQLIDLNSATADQLKELPGVGDATAAKIIANRPYSSVKGLSKAGLTANQIEKISPKAVAKRSPAAADKAKRSATSAAKPKAESRKKIDLNTASADELQTLPGVGPAMSKKIIDNRPYSSVSDLKKAGLPADTMKKVTPMVSATKSSSARKNAPQPASAGKRAAAPKAAGSSEKAAPTAEAAAAAKSGKVWLNTESNVYHRSGDRYFGATRSGKFVTEEEAIRAGARESGKD